MSLLDTDVAPAPPAEATPLESSRATVTPGNAWRKARLPIALGLVFVVVALIQAIVTGGSTVGRMDPEAAIPDGGRALATLLRDRGVDVRRVEAPTGSSGVTVFIPEPDFVEMLNPAAFSDARGARDLVVAGADSSVLERLDVAAEAAGYDRERVLDPGCPDPDALAAGAVLLGGVTYGGSELATPCYPDGGQASMLVFDDDGRRVTVLGSSELMTNEHLDEEGNAALALRLLSRQRTVEWVLPRNLALGEEEKTLWELVPRRVVVATAQAFVVLLLLALWRGRRLGPVVVEPLPVVVRAAETVEGRARLYEAAHARDQAANALRAGLRDRLVRVLGLASDANPQMLVAAVTARTGRDPVLMTDLLYGPPPADDAALVRLATDLDRLDTEVRAL